jgi:putative DNA primase/helicase
MPELLSNSSGFHWVPLSERPQNGIAWLWPGRFALGKLAILDGDPGLGKSFVALDLCARLTTGRPFPDGSPAILPANVIVLNGEDGPEDTIMERLQFLGADLDRVFIPQKRDDHSPDLLSIPTHLKALDEAITQTGAKLVVFDPLVSFLDRSILSASDQSVRRALYPLALLAAKHRCVILLIRHLNKSFGTRSIYRGGGSIGFIGACRSAWLIAPDPHVPDRRILAQVKNNLAPPQPSLAFTLTTEVGQRPRFEWLGTSVLKADQILAAVKTAAPAPACDRAVDTLETFLLENGPRTSREIWTFAEEREISERTLTRAKKELEIRSERIWADGQRLSYWLLPGQELPPEIPPSAKEPDLEPWLAPLREAYPPPTPIDDL